MKTDSAYVSICASFRQLLPYFVRLYMVPIVFLHAQGTTMCPLSKSVCPYPVTTESIDLLWPGLILLSNTHFYYFTEPTFHHDH